jgi:Cu-Zn family superoxide dismutase
LSFLIRQQIREDTMKPTAVRVFSGTVLLSAALAAGIPVAQALAQTQANQSPQAHAQLSDGQGKPLGTAALVETSQGVLIQLRLKGVPPGSHGLHIHQTGRCDPPKFESAGGHYNPTDARHGLQNPEGAHAGDLPNVFVQQDGVLDLDVVAAEVTLDAGPNSLFKDGGTALVMHAGPDDYESDPSGHSGDRIGCGVIERQPVQ